MASRWVKESVGDFILFCSEGVGGENLLVHYMCYMCYFSMFMIDVGEIGLYTQTDHQRNKERSTYPKEEHSQIPVFSTPPAMAVIDC